MKKFEVGKQYYATSICDSNCIFKITVFRRTEKTLFYMQDNSRARRTRIKTDEKGNEFIQPDNYSMAPVFRAERELKEVIN